MTAEISILNRLGVALAADSAVSIGKHADKIWTSAEKLFQVSEVDPVGLMVYGNAEFVGLPWETIIKAYRQRHGTVSRSTIEDHATALISYLESNGSLFPQPAEDDHTLNLCAAILLRVRSMIREEIDKQAEKNNGLNPGDIPPILDATVETFLNFVLREPTIDGFPATWVSQLRKRYSVKIQLQIANTFGKLLLTTKARRQLVNICIHMLGRQVFGPSKAGLVVAGFGSEQYLPALQAYEVEGLALGKVRLRLETRALIGGDTNAAVIPFAQNEMVHTFMNGIDPYLQRFMTKSIQGVLYGAGEKVMSALASTLSADQRTALQSGIDGLGSDLKKLWAREQEKYWSPIMANIATLPKDELAAMAEAFISLTKFKRRVSSERETVGGPVDVAVITRGDGFVWVKRKHYFDAEKNPRFIARLGR